MPEGWRMIRYALLAVFLTGVPVLSQADDFQSWQWTTVDVFNNDDWRFYLYGDNRIGDDLSRSYIQIVSPRLKYHFHENLDLGLGYAFLNIDPLTGADDYWQHRAEFEFNPKFSMGPWSFHNRNRLELRWNNGEGKRLPRLRNRFQVKYKLGDGLLNNLYANNEFFFLLDSGTYGENRMIPAALGLKLSDHVNLDLFYMIQSIDRPDGWENAHIAGTFLQIK